MQIVPSNLRTLNGLHRKRVSLLGCMPRKIVARALELGNEDPALRLLMALEWQLTCEPVGQCPADAESKAHHSPASSHPTFSTLCGSCILVPFDTRLVTLRMRPLNLSLPAASRFLSHTPPFATRVPFLRYPPIGLCDLCLQDRLPSHSRTFSTKNTAVLEPADGWSGSSQHPDLSRALRS